MSEAAKILTAATEDGASESFQSHGGVNTVLVAGAFDGATVTVQISGDGETWVNTAVAFTAAGTQNFVSGRGFQHRLAVTSAGDETSIDAWRGYGLSA